MTGWLPYLLSGWLFLTGLYGVVSSRNFVHLVMCLAVVQSATYVLILQVGYVAGGTAPIFLDRSPRARTVDPVVQSLVLTDVVVGVLVAALLLALALQAHKSASTLDPSELRPLVG